jgi:hypothetical protein
VSAVIETSGRVGRWEAEARLALALAGYDQLVEVKGSTDYQGGGVILARSWRGWAVLAWSYGSCSGCDAYEDMGTRGIVDDMTSAIAHCTDEKMARERYGAEAYW